MTSPPAPQSQRAGVRPISFVLNDVGQLSAAVTLSIRPEELTRTEPSRSTVHQTLGRGVTGWVDNFGSGIPSVSISGHTGWRTAAGSGEDGVAAFAALNALVVKDYHAAKQRAINAGVDPGLVQLLFVDLLDDFAWSVVPTQFVLRRSKSRPLLFQYNINLQAVSTSIDTPVIELPNTGSPSNGLLALDRAIEVLDGFEPDDILLGSDFDLGGVLGDLGGSLGGLVDLSSNIFGAVSDLAGAVGGLADSAVGDLIGVASKVASVGLNVFRSIASIANLPASIMARVNNVASAYNEVICLFANALRPKKVYEQYSGLYGTSNCASTVGGSAPSPFAGLNVFEMMLPGASLINIGSEAMSSIGSLAGMDVVLDPLPFDEIGRHVGNILDGVSL